MDKTPQIAEEHLVMTMDKAQETKIQKLAFRCFLLTSAKAKKFQDGDRSIRLYTTISLQLKCFSKIATIFYQKDSRSFYFWVHQEAKRSILQDYELTDTHTHTSHKMVSLGTRPFAKRKGLVTSVYTSCQV